MSNKMWDVLVEHAKTCVLSGNHYIYYPDDLRHVGVVFNNIYELTGLIAGDQYHPADTLSDSQKVCVVAVLLPSKILYHAYSGILTVHYLSSRSDVLFNANGVTCNIIGLDMYLCLLLINLVGDQSW